MAEIFFGPAGNSEQFYSMGYKHTVQAMKYLNEIGLNAYEYQCGRGVNVGEKTSGELKKQAEEYKIKLSLHAPYYISLASPEELKRENSIKYILQSAKAAKNMGAERIVVHPGGLSGRSRNEALDLAKETLEKALTVLDENDLSDIIICPETMGKINQLGDLDEIIELCSMDKRLIPCIDFGHLNARTHGYYKTKDNIKEIFERIDKKLEENKLKNFHSHFSKIEYSKGGEVRHLTFEDDVFGPDYKIVLDVVHKFGFTPRIICESAGTQSEDALIMKKYFESIRGE